MDRPLTREELKLVQQGPNRETIAEKEILADETGWHSVSTAYQKAGVFCILEFKRMSDVTDQYLLRARFRAENQYESLRRALGITLQRQG